MSADRKPSYVYKLVPHDASPPLPPAPLPDALPVSELDRKSGFIHLSTAPQVLGTLVHFFVDHPLVYVLRLPYDRLESLIRWEDPKGEVCGDRPGEGLFPHLYNGLRVGNAEVDGVRYWDREAQGQGARSWAEIVKEAETDGWLVY